MTCLMIDTPSSYHASQDISFPISSRIQHEWMNSRTKEIDHDEKQKQKQIKRPEERITKVGPAMHKL